MSARKKLDEIKLKWGLGTDRELAQKLKTSKSNIDSWVKRDKIPDKWDMIIVQMSNKEEKKIDTNSNSLIIPHLDNIVASAGGGSYPINEAISMMTFDTQFLQTRLGISNHKNIHTISASGDSMQPTINNGDLLFVLPFENEYNVVKDGAIYVLNCDNSIFVKRIKTNPVKKTITLISDNKDYEPIIFCGDELDRCNIVGRVVLYMGIA